MEKRLLRCANDTIGLHFERDEVINTAFQFLSSNLFIDPKNDVMIGRRGEKVDTP